LSRGGRGSRFSRISSANSNLKGRETGKPFLNNRLIHFTRVNSSIEVSNY
jgi:hypothetical protein